MSKSVEAVEITSGVLPAHILSIQRPLDRLPLLLLSRIRVDIILDLSELLVVRSFWGLEA